MKEPIKPKRWSNIIFGIVCLVETLALVGLLIISAGIKSKEHYFFNNPTDRANWTLFFTIVLAILIPMVQSGGGYTLHSFTAAWHYKDKIDRYKKEKLFYDQWHAAQEKSFALYDQWPDSRSKLEKLISDSNSNQEKIDGLLKAYNDDHEKIVQALNVIKDDHQKILQFLDEHQNGDK